MNSLNIYLRAIEVDDYLISYKWRNDFDLIIGYSKPRFVSKETEKKWALQAIEEHERGKSIRLAICLAEEDKLIGYASLLNIDYQNRSCEAGMLIGDRKYHKKGFATEARKILFIYAFVELGLERVWSRILSFNTTAISSAEKFGYKREGIQRRAVYRNGQYHDIYLFAILREEFLDKYFEEQM